MNNVKEKKESKFAKKGYRQYQDEFIEKYKAGMSVRGIAEEYNISKNIVSKYIREKMELKPKNKAYEHKEEIRSLYLDGWSINSLCKKFGVGHGSISNILIKEYGIKTIKNNTYEHLAKDFVKDYNEGLSGEDIARKYGVNRTTVLRYINEEGVESRSYSEAGRIYDVKEDYFDILTPKKAYLLGEYCASATIAQTMHAPAIQFCLPYKDKDTILRLAHHITDKDETNFELDGKANVYKLRVNSKRLCNKLEEYGFNGDINNKLLYEKGVIHEFYQGLFKNIITFTARKMSFGSTRFNDSIIEYLSNYIGFKNCIVTSGEIYIENKKDIRVLFEKLPYIKDMFVDYYSKRGTQGPWTRLYNEYTETNNI